MTKEQIIHEISTASEPGRMTTLEAYVFYEAILEAIINMKEALIVSTKVGICPNCGLPQYECPSGVVCENGHGY